jgi:hypothetical protein
LDADNEHRTEQTMKNFLAIYVGTPATLEKSGWNRLDPAVRHEREASGMRAWGEWMATHKASVVVTGGPLGKTKRVDAEGVSDVKNSIVGYVVVQAESHDAAARMFEKHPHFTIFPGEGVEIMECLPIPEGPRGR